MTGDSDGDGTVTGVGKCGNGPTVDTSVLDLLGAKATATRPPPPPRRSGTKKVLKTSSLILVSRRVEIKSFV